MIRRGRSRRGVRSFGLSVLFGVSYRCKLDRKEVSLLFTSMYVLCAVCVCVLSSRFFRPSSCRRDILMEHPPPRLVSTTNMILAPPIPDTSFCRSLHIRKLLELSKLPLEHCLRVSIWDEKRNAPGTFHKHYIPLGRGYQLVVFSLEAQHRLCGATTDGALNCGALGKRTLMVSLADGAKWRNLSSRPSLNVLAA